MKIVIVGAGVSGLATYLQLHKLLPPSPHPHRILIYESHEPRRSTCRGAFTPSSPGEQSLTDSAPVVGNSIALAANAVRLLKSIDPRLYDVFKDRGYVNKSYTFRTARGHTLAVTSTGDRESPEEFTISCPRHVLWECFHEVVGEDNIEYRRVIEIDLSGEKPVVKLADGGEEDADLVIGADGVRSIVKKSMFGKEDESKYAPRYEGFCGVGSFEDMELPDTITTNKSMVFTFGPTGSFGYCSAAPAAQRKLGWWSNWGVSQVPRQNVLSAETIRKQLQERHGTWKDPVIQRIIQSATTDLIYPIWTMPDLPFWGRNGAILLGDAAHTLQATSGQGACQALEDSITLSLLLSHYVRRISASDNDFTVREALKLTAKGLYEIRHARIVAIRNRARNLYVTSKPINNVVLEYLYYCFVYLFTNYQFLGKLIVGNVFKELDEFNAEERVREYLRTKEY